MKKNGPFVALILFSIFTFLFSGNAVAKSLTFKEKVSLIDDAASRGGMESARLIFSFLRDGDMRVRTYALSRLVDLGEEAVPVLVENIGDEEVRWLVSGALINIGEKCIPALMDVLRRGSSREKANALFVIEQLEAGEAVPLIRKLVHDPNPDVRVRAISALGKIAGEENVSFIVDFLGDEDEDLRNAAITVLGEVGEEALPYLASVFQSGTTRERVSALKALGRIPSERSYKLLVEGLGDVEPQVRYQACVSLGDLGMGKAVEVLVRLFNDPVGYVREAAVDAVAKLASPGDPIIRKLLEEGNEGEKISAAAVVRKRKFTAFSRHLAFLLKDPSPAVRVAAAAALIELEDPATIEPLVNALKDEQVRWFAILALKRFGHKNIRPLLSRDEDTELNYWKQYTLEQMGEKAIEGCIAVLKKSSDLGVKVSSICTLSQIRSQKAVYPLVKLLSDERLADVVEFVLEKMDSHSVEPLIVGLSDEDPTVRKRCARILGRIGDERALKPLLSLACTDEVKEVRLAAVESANAIAGSGE
ncbi:MAG: hypothetical protein D6713_01120 [Deltaproteobacteria bacterium]|nr:MAG: hypothetical protein D6713_01120 [Deltaproteobacteria bacterium]